MNHTSVSLAGNIIFYSITEWTSRQALLEGLRAVGMGSHVPQPRTPPAAFQDALKEVFAGSGWYVKRLQDSDSFEVVKVELRPFPEHNRRTDYCVARIDPDGEVRFEPTVPDEGMDVVAAYNRHLGLLKPDQVGRSLVSVIASLRGVCLRPTGGVYWLPADAIGQWREVCDVIETAGVGGVNKVYVVEHPMTPDSVRAVADALVNEVTAEVSRVDAEVNDPKVQLGERALRNREHLCYEIRKKIRAYEGMLGTSLAALTREVERVEDAAAMATLNAASTTVA